MGQLGTMLTRAREARGLTIDDAERDTRISKRYLAALEAEEFEVIPAPVYARGFLRSYSQYLGLDPKDALALFPRDEDAPSYEQPARPSNQTPLSPVSASRPAWKRPPHPGQQPPPSAPRPAARQAPAPSRQAPRPEPGWEPTIGVDIGVPAPARRIRTDPAAQTRTAAVAVVAVCAVFGVLLLAFIISRVAGGGGDTGADTTATESAGASTGAETPATAATATSGEIPSVVGMQLDDARAAIESLGFVVGGPLESAGSEPEGQVIDQSPAAGTTWPAGTTVTVFVSTGPS